MQGTDGDNGNFQGWNDNFENDHRDILGNDNHDGDFENIIKNEKDDHGY